MKHGGKFHFAGIYLFKFILHLKTEKSSRFFRFLFFQLLNFLKCMILASLKCCSILSIGALKNIFHVPFSIFKLKIWVFDELYDC